MPTEEQIRSALEAKIGSSQGLDSVVFSESECKVYCDLDAVTKPYLVKTMLECGGVPLDLKTGAERTVVLPWYVDRRWLDHSFLVRTYITVRFFVSLLATGFGTRAR